MRRLVTPAEPQPAQGTDGGKIMKARPSRWLNLKPRMDANELTLTLVPKLCLGTRLRAKLRFAWKGLFNESLVLWQARV